MAGRVEGKIAVVFGGGQTPGETIGNGRATSIVLAREGARVTVVDRDLERAEETANEIREAGNSAVAAQCDITDEAQVGALIEEVLKREGRIDILHNNVGASIALGDTNALDITAEAFERSFKVNLEGMWLCCKHALPALRESHGSIVNIASMAAVEPNPNVAYKTMKTAVVALTENLAVYNADYGVRANAILPGLMNTPMAIENRIGINGMSREDVVAMRDKRVPLGRKMGTGWDVANAALFLHSDEASFISGVSLLVDGAQSVAWGH
ncbi:MAG TPA: SDR family NAD(P)-dependent oxidoreductase [Dehalococcoidia bacterium]|nr:SDR family NAD(P)-dependent oxidoreductase [Dehalococcoidia bacterium]